MDSADAAVAARAAHQHGLVTRDQARAAGVTDAGVRHRIATGRWARVGASVYRVAGTPVTWESDVLATVLAGGPEAVASHRCAAALWHLDGARPGRPEVTLPRGSRRPSGRSARVHWSTDLHLVRPVRRQGIPTTPVARTLLDLGGGRAGRRCTWRSTTPAAGGSPTGPTSSTCWSATPTWPAGRGRAARPADGARGRGRGDRERVRTPGRRAAGDGGPPGARAPAPRARRRPARLDLAYPPVRVGIELDGSIHLRRDVWEADHARQNALVLAGWTILRFTWADYRQRRTALVAEVARALAAAA